MVWSDDVFADEIQTEWRQALPGIIAGKPDRTDLMVPLKRVVGGRDTVTMTEIVDLVAREVGMRPAKIWSRSRTRAVCNARFMAFYIANELRGYQSLGDLGKMLRRDHTTAGNAIRQAENLMARSTGYRASCESVLSKLGRSTELT